MAKFSELTTGKQMGIILLVLIAISAGLYFVVYKSMDDENRQSHARLKAKEDENALLRPYEAKKVEMEQRIASLKLQLDSLNRIVPEEKEAPGFMKMMQAEALRAGILIRRYTSQPVASREFFTEVPFGLDLDGSYYSLLRFFDNVSKLDRIVNITGLKMATVKKPSDAGVKKQYQYNSAESVVVTCTATTFYSHGDTPAPAGSAPAK